MPHILRRKKSHCSTSWLCIRYLKHDVWAAFCCLFAEREDTVLIYNEVSLPLIAQHLGYASDISNMMFGQHSVVSLLKEKIPFLFTMKCLCHSAHLCASHACEKLPRAIEDLARDIYSHFSHSAKWLAEYEKFQHFTNTTPHKLQKPAQTRWLSLEQCVT